MTEPRVPAGEGAGCRDVGPAEGLAALRLQRAAVVVDHVVRLTGMSTSQPVGTVGAGFAAFDRNGNQRAEFHPHAVAVGTTPGNSTPWPMKSATKRLAGGDRGCRAHPIAGWALEHDADLVGHGEGPCWSWVTMIAVEPRA